LERNIDEYFVSRSYWLGMYAKDTYFARAWKACKVPWSIDRTPHLYFHIQEGFLFKNQRFFIPWSSFRLNLVRELHSGDLCGHFGIDKTITLVKEIYFWPSINKDVKKIVECCRIFQLAKGRS